MLFLRIGTSSERQRRAGKDAGGEPSEGRRSTEKGIFGAAKERGRTLQRISRAAKTKRGGFAEKETARRGRTCQTDEIVGQKQIPP